MARTLWTTVDDAWPQETDEPRAAPESSSTAARDALYERYRPLIAHNPALDRSIVSYQANKRTPFYGWFKYREGFSEGLVKYALETLHPQPGVLLDPFAGSGAALFAASDLGWQTTGIEVLPVGVFAMNARIAATRVDRTAFHAAVQNLPTTGFTAFYDPGRAPQHLAITRGAFPPDEEIQLVGFLAYCEQHIADADVQRLMRFAAFCVLEDISYTRKDGQYLRWDARSGRSQGKRPFNKGRITGFQEALRAKLRQMIQDLGLAATQTALFTSAPSDHAAMPPQITEGSCLTLLPVMESASLDFVLTSPPYANRYDYTRTYALELLFLGCDDAEVKRLRQTMLSCTVENRDKQEQLRAFYGTLGRERDFDRVHAVFQSQAALQETLAILDAYRAQAKLNNDHVARLVRNYFYEMCFVIAEFTRLLKPGGIITMVNDNVRYAGEDIPVDLILSDFAASLGLSVRTIWTLGRGKGNSSQQMGHHGRSELRKCVYVWEKA
ncbi:MAG TPA: hypothetical protein VF725_11770 [Ktedonobacterales bacterium]